MERMYPSFSARAQLNLLSWGMFCALLLGITQVFGQDSQLSCNTFTATNWVSPAFSLTATGWTNPGNTINSTTSDYANTNSTSAILRIGDPTNTYINSGTSVSGYYINVHVGRPGLTAGGNVTVRTYSGTTLQETYTTNVDGGLGDTEGNIGFYTSKAFNSLQIQNGTTNTIRVYYVSLQKFCKPTLNCNTLTSITRPNFVPVVNADHTGATGGVFVTTGFSNDNVVDNDPTSVATFTPILTLAGSVSLAVKDQVNDFTPQTFVGFDISNATLLGVNIGSSISFKTYLDGQPAETISGTSLLVSAPLASSTGRQTVGFVANQAFDEIQIIFSQGAGASIGTTTIYNAVIKRFCENPTALACNTYTPLNQAVDPIALDGANTGITGTCVGCSIVDASNVIDGNASTAATIASLASVSAVASIAVKNQLQTYPSNTYVGFDVQTNTLVALDLLGGISITLYSSGSAVQTLTGSNLLLGVSAVTGGTSRQLIGGVSSVAFDEAKISFTKTGADLGTTSVFGISVKRFCANNAEFACNTYTPLNESSYPIAINPANTGITGTCVGCNVNNAQNVIDGDANTAATIASLASVSAVASISVRNQLQTYPANTFVGFDVQTNTLASANLLGAITITLYNSGTVVQTLTGPSLFLGVSAVTGGTSRQLIGLVSSATFNEAKISFTKTGADLGTTSVYGISIKRFCTGPALACNTQTVLDEAVYPVAIDPANTGITGTCVNCSIANASNVIDSFTATAATINTTGGVNYTATIGVKNQLETYPVNTFAGFDVETTTLLSADLFGSVTITLYNNGSAVQSATGSNLILGASTDILTGTGNSRQVIGIVSTVPAFNEIKISFSKFGTIDLGTTYVYSAVVQKACATPIVCNSTYYLANPAFPTVINPARTGVTDGVCVACAVQNPGNVISPSTTDFARIQSAVGAAATTGLSVYDPLDTYPAGSYAGFVVKKNNFPISLNLLANVTVTTYNDGVLQESKSSTNLLDLTVLFNIFGPGNNTIYNIGFATTKPFDEVRLSLGSIVGALDTYVDVYSAFVDTRTAYGSNLLCFSTNPDFAVTNKNVSVSGSLKTNDVAGPGTTYGSPVSTTSPTGSTPSLVINADGTYTFTSATPGVYVYQVAVCPPSQTTACPTSTFTITVLDPTILTNPPVANPDFVRIAGSSTTPTSATVAITANDGPGNTAGSLNTPTIVGTPTSGSATATIDPATGNLIYTPAVGFYGSDLITYQVCETPGGLCATTQVTVTVSAPGSTTVSIVDDYVSTVQNLPIESNVLSNDQGTGLTVSNPGTVTVPNVGTLVLTSTGSYTYTPATDVTGPVTFTYTACDNNSVCGTATLHLLVVPASDLTATIYARPTTVNSTTTISVVVDVFELNSVDTKGAIVLKVSKDPKVSLNLPAGATSIGGRPVQNSAWTLSGPSGGYYTLTTNQVITAGNVLSFGLQGTITPGATSGNLTLSTVVVAYSGAEGNFENNNDADKIDYFQQ
ncbi:beta strand repeat-containing protein [Spirosoma koreense]